MDGSGGEALARLVRQPALLTLSAEQRRHVMEAATHELAVRAGPALVSHLLLLVVAALASGTAHRHPVALAGTAGAALLIGLVRVRLAGRARATVRWWRAFGHFTRLSALVWGASGFAITVEEGPSAGAVIYWMMMAGMAAASTASLKPHPALARHFVAAVLVPIAFGCVVGTAPNLALAGVIVIYLLFLVLLGREVSSAFWEATVHASVLKARTDELAAFKENTTRDLVIAERVFRNILDRSVLDLASLRLHLSSLEQFNGDVAMALPIGGRRVRFFLGDLTGHGLGAAVGALPIADVFFASTQRGLPLEIMLQEMNRKLRWAMPRGIFLSALAAELDLASGRLVYWNGGLPEGYLFDSDGRIRARLPSTHLPIGILDDAAFDAALDGVDLQPGDRIFVATDGVIETADSAGELFGRERLERALTTQPGAPFWSAALDEALRTYRGGNLLQDDTTYLELRYDDELRADLERHRRQVPERPWKTEVFEQRFDPDRLRGDDPMAEVRDFIARRLSSEAEVAVAHNVVSELFVNAVDHGLLRLDSRMKDASGGVLRYFKEREARLASLQDGRIIIRVSFNDSAPERVLNIRVENTGSGFVFGNPDERRLVDSNAKHGRGIPLVRSFCRKANWLDGGRVAEAELVVSATRS